MGNCFLYIFIKCLCRQQIDCSTSLCASGFLEGWSGGKYGNVRWIGLICTTGSHYLLIAHVALISFLCSYGILFKNLLLNVPYQERDTAVNGLLSFKLGDMTSMQMLCFYQFSLKNVSTKSEILRPFSTNEILLI